MEFRLISEQRQAVFVLQRTAGGAEPHWLLVKGWDKESWKAAAKEADK